MSRIVRQHLNALRRAGKLPKVVDIAIDMHCYQRYDKEQTKYTVKTMFKKSVKLCEEYMTAQIVNVGATLTVAKLQVKKGAGNPDLIRKIIKTCHQQRLILGAVLPNVSLNNENYIEIERSIKGF